MKRIFLILFSILLCNGLIAQRNSQSGVVIASEFHITKPIREIFAENPVDENQLFLKGESEDKKHRKAQKFKFSVKDGPQYGNDEQFIQRIMGNVTPIPLKSNWLGQSASGFRPFDPSGAVGPNHYIQMINSTTFKVYNKTSGVVMLTGTLGNLWSPATANAGDPIVMYDKAANRWFLAQFGSGNQIYIAVSQTADPTGAYYTYTYISPVFPDYLKFSVWSDGYYMTSNQSPQKVFAFNRSEILAGTPGARSVYTNFSPPSSGFFCPLPGDAADGTLPPAGTPCPIFSYSDNGWGASYSDAVNIYNMSVNWVPTTPTATITLAAIVPTVAFDASYDPSWNDCVQPGTTQKLDAIGGVCMYRAQWKSWSGYNTIILNWSVKISTTQRSIKWCELRQNQSTGTWSIYQEGIYSPDGSTRWMGSILMDDNGSIGLSYLKSDATSIYPGLYYTGRRTCDPLGTLPITEALVIAGTGSQTGVNRVGDYSHSVLDPDGVTIWSTSEYMGGSTGGSAAKTRIFSYQITPCSLSAGVNIAITSGANPQCSGSSITFTATPVNGGSAPAFQWKVDGVNVGTNSPVFTSNSLSNSQVVTCQMTSNLSGVTGNPATSNAVLMSVLAYTTPTVSIALTSGTNPTCPGANMTFTATTTNAGTTPVYQWKIDGLNAGTNSSTFTSSTLSNSQVVSCVVTSTAQCNAVSSATSNNITVVMNATPSVSIAQTAGSNPFCTGNSVTFTATATNATSPTYQWKVNGTNAGTNSPNFITTTLTNGQVITCQVTAASSCPSLVTIGTSTTLNASSSNVGAAYPTFHGNGKQQYLILASELTAMGLSAGNISSLAFNLGNTTGNPSTLNSYRIRMGATTATALTTTFQAPTFTTVFGPSNYTPQLNTWNTHTFSTPFAWNGTSNIVVDICFSNSVTGSLAYQNYQTSSTFVSNAYYQANGSGGAGACTATTATGSGSVRPNMQLTKSGTTTTVISNSITASVNSTQVPSVSIAISSGANPTCTGSSLTFTATPTNGGSPVYQWKVNGANVGTNSSIYTTSALTNGQIVSCTMTSSLSCANPISANSNSITMTVNPILVPSVSISISSGSNPSCAGVPVNFFATAVNGGTPSFQWKVNGVNAGTNSPNFNTSTLTNGQIVSCVMTSTANCVSTATATSNAINMTINPTLIPSVSISIVSGTNPACAGTPISFQASTVNGGTPSFQWKVNGVNTGTNNSIFTSNSLLNGQLISCVMSSSEACANPATTNSNSINMTINALPVVVASNTTGCAGIPIALSGSPTGGSFSVANPYSGPSTTFTYSYTNSNGCSATSAPSNITVNAASNNSAQSATACNAYTWLVNGMTYFTSGIKTASFTNMSGCDSTRTLNLTIHSSTSSNLTVTAVNTYTWNANNMTYTNSGTYTVTLVNASGCDSNLTLNLTINLTSGISLSPKVLLSGPYQTATGLMHDSLRVNNLIPLTEPYSTPPLNMPQIGYPGGETVSASILNVTGPNAIVDWVYLELRSSLNHSIILATKRALLQRDGDVVSSLNGSSPIIFPNQAPGNYYVSIKHRNHLGVMTESPIALTFSSTTIDFTSSNPVWVNPLIVNAPRKSEGTLRLLIVGDANTNKHVKYNGTSNDKDFVLSAVGVATPNNILTGYRNEDVNLDSKVRYNNTDNDRAVILNSVGANTPNIILFQHTPN